MKNKAIIYFLTGLSIWICAGGNADASAVAMGGFQTVASDGSHDVLRNPSLLAAQERDNAMGVLFAAVPFTHRRYSYSAAMASFIARPLFRETKRLAGSACLSYSRKTERGTVGIAVDADTPSRALYLQEKHRRNYTGLNSRDLTFEYLSAAGDSTAISPRLVISYGLAVSGNHSLGVQWTAGYTRAVEKDNFLYVSHGGISGSHRATKKTEDIGAEMSLGYAYRNETSQAGLMLRSGRFNWEKTKISFSHGDFGKGLVFSGGVREPFYLQYDRGFSVLAGGSHRLATFLSVAVEGEYEIPISYNYKAVRYDETTWLYGRSINMTVRKTGLYSLRAGFEILPTGPVTVSLGGSVSTTRERWTGRNRKEAVNTDLFSGSLGLDIRAADTLLIMTGARLAYTHQRTRRSSNQEYIGSISIDGLARTLAVDLFLGLSGGF